MTHDLGPTDSEILLSLRRAAATAPPEGARRRVAARLVSAGIMVASGATSVAGSAAAAMQAAGSASASGVGLASGGVVLVSAGLTKVFALGLALGAATGLGAHAVSRVVAPERTMAAPFVPTSGVATAQIVEPLRSLEATTAGGIETDESTPLITNLARPRDSAGALRRVPPPLAPRIALNQTPELPSVGVREERRARLAEQQTLLDGARAALRAGDAMRALRDLEQHRAVFPVTAFEEERSALEIRACVSAGDNARARERLIRFERRFGASLQLSSLRQVVLEQGASPARVTDPEPSQQSIVGAERR
jgi:hypothetical protein